VFGKAGSQPTTPAKGVSLQEVAIVNEQ